MFTTSCITPRPRAEFPINRYYSRKLSPKSHKFDLCVWKAKPNVLRSSHWCILGPFLLSLKLLFNAQCISGYSKKIFWFLQKPYNKTLTNHLLIFASGPAVFESLLRDKTFKNRTSFGPFDLSCIYLSFIPS